MRPRIGIMLDLGSPEEGRKTLELPADYAASIVRAGGLPLLLAPTHDEALRREMIASVDGLLIPGGNDIDPKLYGQAIHPATQLVDTERQDFDLAMISLAEARRMPALGICMGCQLMNVQRQGSLHQHLPELSGAGDAAMEHRRAGDRVNAHAVQVRAGSQLAAALQTGALEANSRHHQGISRIGHGLVASAAAPDGLVEAIEDPSLPFWIAVQWHPENLAGTPHEKLFAALVKAAAAFRAQQNP